MKKLWLFVPVLILIFAVAYTGRERLVPEPSEPAQAGVPDTGSTGSLVAGSAPAASSTVAAVPAPQTAAQGASTAPAISFSPSAVIQGDPVEIVVKNVPLSGVKSIAYNGTSLGIFSDGGSAAAVTGIALRAASGSYPVVVTLADGETLRKNLVVGSRVVATAPLGIPDSLGGNTEQAAQNLVSDLSHDNAILNAIPSAGTALWSGAFQYPISNPVVTDTYGYTRSTVDTTISHEGTDFRAPPGTPVYAVNSGKVALAQYLTSYGNAIVIDHGLGVQSLYLHLSEMDVKPGDTVTKGELIGKSGETGYAEGPHLHLSIKINHVSIDPQEFLKIF